MKSSSTRPVSAECGFTLIELLIVIIIIAILAAVAIPTYMSSRASAQDSAAVTLVRNALTAVEAANLDYFDYEMINQTALSSVEPTITWNIVAAPLIDPTVPTVNAALVSVASADAVDFYAASPTIFDIATASDSGNRYGIRVQSSGAVATDYIKVRVIDGTGTNGW